MPGDSQYGCAREWSASSEKESFSGRHRKELKTEVGLSRSVVSGH